MLGIVLALQLAAAAQRTPTYSSPSLEAFIAEAVVANRLPPPELLGYSARVESELSLLVRDTLGRERIAQVEQVAMSASWRRGADYALRVIGYRSQTVGVPYSALSIARSWTVPYLYGDRLTLGVDVGQGGAPASGKTGTDSSGRRSRGDTLRAIHPLAIDRAAYYRYSGGDTVAVLRSRARAIPIARVASVQSWIPFPRESKSVPSMERSTSTRSDTRSCGCVANSWRAHHLEVGDSPQGVYQGS